MADLMTTFGGGGGYPQQQGAPGMPAGSRQDRPSITTSMFTLWDEGGNQIRLSCLDNSMSFGVWVPAFASDGRRSYPVEQRYSTVVQAKGLQAMVDAISNKIVPAYEAGRSAKFGIYTNNAQTNMIEIEVKNGEFFFNLHKNCDSITHIPQFTVVFKFDVYYIVSKFDPATGEQEIEPIQADFFIFYKALQGFLDMAMGSIAGHGNRTASINSYNTRLMEYLRSMMEQIRMQLPAPANTSGTPGFPPQLPQYGPQSRPSGMYGQNSSMPVLDGEVPAPAPVSQNSMPPAATVTEVQQISDLM